MRSFLIVLALCSVLLGCRTKKNYILIVDTSQSMVSNNLINDVKESVRQISIDAKPGDQIFLNTFDSNVRPIGHYKINSQKDLKKVFSDIQTIKAKGKWTHLVKALQMSLEKVVHLQKAEADRKNIIVFYTDGRHDPPPNEKENSVNFKNLVSKYYKGYKPHDSWFIYYVELGEVDPDLQSFLKETKSGTMVSGRTLKKNKNFLKEKKQNPQWIQWSALGFLVLAIIYFTRPWWRGVNISLISENSSIDLGHLKGRLARGEVALGDSKNPSAVVGLNWRGDVYVKPKKPGGASLNGQALSSGQPIKTGQTLRVAGEKFTITNPKKKP